MRTLAVTLTFVFLAACTPEKAEAPTAHHGHADQLFYSASDQRRIGACKDSGLSWSAARPEVKAAVAAFIAYDMTIPEFTRLMGEHHPVYARMADCLVDAFRPKA